MQVEVNKKCMKPILVAVTSGFRDLAPSSFPSNLAKLTFQTGSYYSPWGQLKKFMQVEIDGKCMQTNF